MARSYYNFHHHSVGPPSLVSYIFASLPCGLRVHLQRLWNSKPYASVSTTASPVPTPLHQLERNWSLRRLLILPNLLIAVWVLLLLWGERWVFQSSIESCQWHNWERWPAESTPHHLIFLADPQLIDPHSYPGRPWPLDKLTMMHTDNYLKRSYISLQQRLHPDTIFFLGDLFDGGREWETARGNTQDPSWANGLRPSGEQVYTEIWHKRYGEDYWLHEYDRFGRIFYKYWNLAGADARPWQRGRKIVSSLPGNHDLGFGENIKVPIRNRFEVYFGEGNRVDIVGNHTFVSVDAVSLSAGESTHDTSNITKPVEDFLATVQSLKRRAVAKELALLAGNEFLFQYSHEVKDLASAEFQNLSSVESASSSAELPTILLTHVPLYREPGTPCGPQREHWPPTTPPKGQSSPVFPDNRNAISISKGYQYQNVLSPAHSIKLVSAVGNVVAVFSGDDHDYCEILHPVDKNSAREITAKSISWAMGVRRPGFQMLSMWNPIDNNGQSLNRSRATNDPARVTTETHLCLLPDQLGIFFRYLSLIIITILALLIRAILTPVLNLKPFSPLSSQNDVPCHGLLPLTKQECQLDSSTSSTSSNDNCNNNYSLAPRSSAGRIRCMGPANDYYSNISVQASPDEEAFVKKSRGHDHGGCITSAHKAKPGKSTGGIIAREAGSSIWRVAWVVIAFYLYLARFG